MRSSTLTGPLRAELRRCAARGGGFADSRGKVLKDFLILAARRNGFRCGRLRFVARGWQFSVSCQLPVRVQGSRFRVQEGMGVPHSGQRSLLARRS
jgi:hypothetical protein